MYHIIEVPKNKYYLGPVIIRSPMENNFCAKREVAGAHFSSQFSKLYISGNDMDEKLGK